MRTGLVIVLLILGAVLTLIANLVVWTNRTVFDTDRFVATANRVFEDDEVENQLSVRLTDEIVERGEVQQRLQQRLPEGLDALSLPLTVALRDFIQERVLRVLRSDATEGVLDEALARVHARLIGLLEDRERDDAVVQEQGDQIVINLQGLLARASDELGRDDPNGVLARLDLPEDSGQIVLVEDTGYIKPAAQVARRHDGITAGTVAASALAFLLAIGIASRRQPVIRNIGWILTAVGVLSVLMLIPVRSTVADLAQNPDAGRAAFNALTADFREQSLVLALGGLAVVVVALFFGDSRLARSLRRTARGGLTGAPDLAPTIREAAPLLRASGLAVAALALIAWPDPDIRVYLTVLGLLGAYLTGLWIIASDSPRADRAREQVGSVWQRMNPPDSVVHATGARGWVTHHAGALRIAGVVGGILALALWPELTLAAFVVIVALALLYLALVDWLVVEPQVGESPSR